MADLRKNPVFVIGVFRSGTSLLFSLLNQHRQIGLMYECNVWDFPALLSGVRFRSDWLTRQEFFNQALSRHRLVWGASLKGLEHVKSPEDLYQTFASGRRAAIWGEKAPAYASRMLKLAEQFPDASFVVIWRDPVEIYRSILVAGRTSSFFRRRGMLDRIIAYHEKMIADLRVMKQRGLRVCEVEYAGLVDSTEANCRKICEFLQVPYDPHMATLADADFAGVFDDQNHDHLRRRVITRQAISADIVPRQDREMLERFEARWTNLRRNQTGGMVHTSVFELTCRVAVGRFFLALDQAVRVLYEFMPLSWLKFYRVAKEVIRFSDGRSAHAGMWQNAANHFSDILLSYGVIALIAAVHYAYPHMMFLPLYLIPCGILTVRINPRWGTVAATITAMIGPVVLKLRDPDYDSLALLFWNSFMRISLMTIVLILIERIRLDLKKGGELST